MLIAENIYLFKELTSNKTLIQMAIERTNEFIEQVKQLLYYLILLKLMIFLGRIITNRRKSRNLYNISTQQSHSLYL